MPQLVRQFHSFRPQAFILALLFLALPTQVPATDRDFHIGILYWSMNIPGQVAMRTGLENELQKINQEADSNGLPPIQTEIRIAGDGELGIQNQINQMQELITAGMDLLIVQPADNSALTASLRAANKAGIPVVVFDQYISGGQMAAYLTSDNYQAGYLDGEYISSLFPPGQTIRLILVEYPNVSSTVERVDGFLDAIKNNKHSSKILKSYFAVEPISGARAALDILRDFPAKGSIDVVFTVNDGGGLAVVKGLHAAGRDEIKVATIDGDPDSVENIKAGHLTVIDSAQFCGPLGKETIKAAHAILRGSKPPRHVLMPVFPITKETIALYPGWQEPLPTEFRKPWPSPSPQWMGKLKIAQPAPQDAL